jgi:hypothetical protein
MGDIPLWPGFLPIDHPRKPDLRFISTKEAQNDYAVNIILPLIQSYISTIRRNTANGLRRYEYLQKPVKDWLNTWARHVDVQKFWNSPMGYKPPSYGIGGPAPSSYPPGASSYPPAPSSYPSAPSSYPPGASSYPPAPSSYPSGPGLKLRTPGEFAAGAALGGVAGAGECALACAIASAGECCTIAGGRRKNKRKTIRRRHSKKRTRKTRRV